MRLIAVAGLGVLLWIGSARAESFTVGTADTSVTIEAGEGGIRVTALRDAAGYDWLGGQGCALPLVAEYGLAESSAATRPEGKMAPLAWKVKMAEAKAAERRVEIVLACEGAGLEMRSVWQGYAGPGPVRHSLEIFNRGDRGNRGDKGEKTVVLPLQKTLALELRGAEGGQLEQLWVEKGASVPTRWGVHWGKVAAGYEASLASGVTWPYSKNPNAKPNDPMPWTMLLDRKGRRGVYVGVEFSGQVRIGVKGLAPARVQVTAGLGRDEKAEAEFRTRLPAGGSFEPAPVLVGCFRGDEDDGSNRLRQWVMANLRPAAPAGAALPLLVNNSWGSGMAVDDKLARAMIDSCAAMGVEMFHVDAGWFNAVGDWHPSAGKFPHGLGPVADYAHGKGLRFGLWIAWTQGGHTRNAPGQQGVLCVFDEPMKDWFNRTYRPKWKTLAFVGADLCLGEPRAADWCLGELRRCVKEYKLDLLEHDQRMIVDWCGQQSHPHTGSGIDVSYHAARGYYRVYDTLRAQNPNLLFENCVNGAQMLDFGVMRRTHYTSITDHYDPISNRRAFHDSVYYMPPSMAECYVANHPGKSPANFRTMLRSGMMGWCTIMLNMARWSPEQAALGKAAFDTYKQRLRPLIASADLYHISARPDGVAWDGIEYFDATTGRGVVFAFRGRSPNEPRHTFVLKGLDPAAAYSLTCEDASSPPATLTGRQLMEQGLPVNLPEPDSSELIWIQRKP